MTDTTRSLWGWGLASRFPDREARRQIGQLLEAMIGITPAALLDPTPPDPAHLSPPPISAPPHLAELFDPSPEARWRHTWGRAYPDIVRGFHGDFDGAPGWVAYPTARAQVLALLEWASQERVATIPYGGGTSVVGGVSAPEVAGEWSGTMSLDLGRMNQVLEVDHASLSAHIQAGALGPELEAGLRPMGLTLRHYPQSYEFSTLGGWIATRAGGHYATRYTHIDDLLESVRMITPSGDFETRRLPGSGAGPDPNRLVLGSEGTLGVITEAWIRVQRPPRFRSKASVFFDDFENAVDACRVITQSGLTPANCRLLDRREAMLNGVAFDGSHVLLLGFESATVPHPTRPGSRAGYLRGPRRLSPRRCVPHRHARPER